MLVLLAASPAGFSAEEAGDAEVQLFDGKTLNGWTTLDGKPVTRGWKVVDGAIWLDVGPDGRDRFKAGHIVTERELGDFDLSFQWSLAKGGNSGLKYRVRFYGDMLLGCEYQMIDDQHYAKVLTRRTTTGAIYDLYEPAPDKRLLPMGQFNASRIVVRGKSIRHWLNGKLVVAAEVGSSEWQQRVCTSKFAEHADFGCNRFGKLMLTDHGSEVRFRNFRLKELTPHDNDGKTDEPTSRF